jgi:hypothetical protein
MFLKFEGLTTSENVPNEVSAMFVGLWDLKMANIWDDCGVEEERTLVGLKCMVASWLAVCVAIHSLAGEAVALRNMLSHSGKYGT